MRLMPEQKLFLIIGGILVFGLFLLGVLSMATKAFHIPSSAFVLSFLFLGVIGIVLKLYFTNKR